MQESDKHKLEGLLKARSQDLRQRRRPRSRRPVADAWSGEGATHDGGEATVVTSRACADCGAAIDGRRLHAIPSATRCLGCQRAAEHAASSS